MTGGASQLPEHRGLPRPLGRGRRPRPPRRRWRTRRNAPRRQPSTGRGGRPRRTRLFRPALLDPSFLPRRQRQSDVPILLSRFGPRSGLALTRREKASPKRPLGLAEVGKTYASGITGFSYALAILILAWALKETCEAVETSAYIVGALSASSTRTFSPLLVFLLAAVVAFSIGTSWTTMAVLLPTNDPVAYDLGGLTLTVLVAAAVLDGAIFGDHCSPISDTTVLSSIAAACDHLAHVRTQIPTP